MYVCMYVVLRSPLSQLKQHIWLLWVLIVIAGGYVNGKEHPVFPLLNAVQRERVESVRATKNAPGTKIHHIFLYGPTRKLGI